MTPDRLRECFRAVVFTTPVPFTEDGTVVRTEALASNVEQLYEAGARAFAPCGNTGEYYSLSDDERVAIVECHVEATGSDAVVVGGAAGSVADVRSLADAYADVGADGVMVMHPDHTYLHEDGLAAYYHGICDTSDLGIVLYKRGPEVTRDVLVEVTEREEVVAVKFAGTDVVEFSQTVADATDDVAWINGIAERYAPAFAMEGADGYTTGVGNFLPDVTLALFDAIEDRRWEEAARLQRILRPFEDLREETGVGNVLEGANNVPVVKFGMDLAGYEGGPVREPLVDLSPQDEDRVESYLSRIETTVRR